MKMKRILAIGIILLFFGVTIAPTINFQVVKASQDDDLVEVTTQACGIKGYGNTTVKLTREQYQNLEQYLVDFRERLNQTTTREEAIPIFKEAVVELDKYGLLPRGMNVERAQKLVAVGYLNKREMKLFQNVGNKYQDNSSDSIKNYFCLVAGRVNIIEYWNIIRWIIGLSAEPFTFIGDLFSLMSFLSDFFFYSQLFKLFSIIFSSISIFFYNITAKIGHYYDMYRKHLENQPYLLGLGGNVCFYGGTGWIFTIGLNGIKKINGTLYGQIPYLIKSIGIYLIPPRGIKHFVGLKIYDNVNGNFLLGSAFWVKIGLSPLYP